MIVRAEALREAHRAKTQFDMNAFLTWVAQLFEKECMGYVEIIPSEITDKDWFKSPGFICTKTRVEVAPAYMTKILNELVVQGYNLYARKYDFVASLYQYPSSYFGGTIIYQSAETFLY